MQYLTRYVLCLGAYLLTLSAVQAMESANNNAKRFGEYTIHFNTFPSNFLEPQIANAVGIKRSSTNGVLTIAVKKQREGENEQSVQADITGNAYNLMGQVRKINLREIRDGDAVYYIGDFTTMNQESLTFKLSVKPEGSLQSHNLEFKRKLFTQ